VQFPEVVRDISFRFFGKQPAAFSISVVHLSPVLKMSGHKANQTTLSVYEVLNKWSHSSSSPYAFKTCTETPLPLDAGSMLL